MSKVIADISMSLDGYVAACGVDQVAAPAVRLHALTLSRVTSRSKAAMIQKTSSASRLQQT